jgi:hypothetical protein
MSTRRAFITLFGGAAVWWPLAARPISALPTFGRYWRQNGHRRESAAESIR